MNNNISNFRVFLRSNVYNQETMTILVSYIKQFFDTKDVIPYISDKKIVVKVKKSKSKKLNNENLITNHYKSLDSVFYNFITDTSISNYIRSSILSNSNEDLDNLKETHVLLKSGSNISCLYNATTIDNETIIIYL